MIEPDTELKIWAAGIFDGEGCVVIQQYYGYYYGTKVFVGNTDPRIVEPFCEYWGGQIYVDQNYQGEGGIAYYVYFSPQKAPAMLSDIVQYLKAKKNAATLVLKALKATVGAHNGNRTLGPYFWEGVKKGFWGTKEVGYKSISDPEREASCERVTQVLQAHPSNKHPKVLDKNTGIIHKTRYQCGLALAHEYRISMNTQAWSRIYSKDPDRFELVYSRTP